MIAKASIAKHPIHPMIMPLPLGLWVFAFICDLVARYVGFGLWGIFAFYSMGAGVIFALIAALPGLVDLYFMDDWKVKKIGIWHMSINLAIVALCLINLRWRFASAPRPGHLVLSVVSILLLIVSGWLGGEMVYVHRAAVAERGEE
ncbi:DUF2231 domain-containing protein [Geomesophilobacter sediminis]|uniref:DUF2231 domain-containing protein n=1 Tax=Geomesophilobacter sediminis TaxID=2798584 RepID=A0A8J7LVY5_9BACT|nr:DUF2231 domain-containing protein [Geomesophilobacter sediminis]MBJ6726104.1 DUF2231 domain-containing protein [Geomesophilobacter sediminis]